MTKSKLKNVSLLLLAALLTVCLIFSVSNLGARQTASATPSTGFTTTDFKTYTGTNKVAKYYVAGYDTTNGPYQLTDTSTPTAPMTLSTSPLRIINFNADLQYKTSSNCKGLRLYRGLVAFYISKNSIISFNAIAASGGRTVKLYEADETFFNDFVSTGSTKPSNSENASYSSSSGTTLVNGLTLLGTLSLVSSGTSYNYNIPDDVHKAGYYVLWADNELYLENITITPSMINIAATSTSATTATVYAGTKEATTLTYPTFTLDPDTTKDSDEITINGSTLTPTWNTEYDSTVAGTYVATFNLPTDEYEYGASATKSYTYTVTVTDSYEFTPTTTLAQTVAQSGAFTLPTTIEGTITGVEGTFTYDVTWDAVADTSFLGVQKIKGTYNNDKPIEYTLTVGAASDTKYTQSVGSNLINGQLTSVGINVSGTNNGIRFGYNFDLGGMTLADFFTAYDVNVILYRNFDGAFITKTINSDNYGLTVSEVGEDTFKVYGMITGLLGAGGEQTIAYETTKWIKVEFYVQVQIVEKVGSETVFEHSINQGFCAHDVATSIKDNENYATLYSEETKAAIERYCVEIG